MSKSDCYQSDPELKVEDFWEIYEEMVAVYGIVMVPMVLLATKIMTKMENVSDADIINRFKLDYDSAVSFFQRQKY